MKSSLRIAASLCLVVLSSWALADWVTAQRNFRNTADKDKAVRQLADTKEAEGDELRELIDDYQSATTAKAKEQTYDSIASLLEAHSLYGSYSTQKGMAEEVKKIKSDKIYKTEREAKSANWFTKLLERLKNAFNPPRNNTNTKMPDIPQWIPSLILDLFYVVAAVVVGLLIYVLFKIPWGWTKAGKIRKSRGGMLEEGEELLSEDEYLKEADRLIAEGKFREACRALYLASLLRIDAARIARFEPTQTNWEHLRRIESSKLRPERFEFRPATKAFDLAWYGFRANSAADVDIFRQTYLQIKDLTGAKA